LAVQSAEPYNRPSCKTAVREREMDIGFVWDEAKYKTVVREHNVNFYEAVAAFD